MRYIKQIIKRNKKLVVVCLIIGLFDAFMVNFKVDYFQKVIDALAEHTLTPYRVMIYGIVPQTFSGKISVRKLSFRYGERQILNNISFEIRSGDKVAFVGETGSGKSTIIKLLMGLL